MRKILPTLGLKKFPNDVVGFRDVFAENSGFCRVPVSLRRVERSVANSHSPISVKRLLGVFLIPNEIEEFSANNVV